MDNREKLSSRLGFILLSAGCAIGLGNVWRFPYITGRYGGAAFVLLYLLFLVFMGVPVMIMEFAIGRAGRKKIFSGRRDAGTNFGFYSRMLWRIRMVYGCFRKMGGFSKADPGSRTLAVFSIHGCSQVFGRTCFCISHCILERIVSCL